MTVHSVSKSQMKQTFPPALSPRSWTECLLDESSNFQFSTGGKTRTKQLNLQDLCETFTVGKLGANGSHGEYFQVKTTII